MQNSTFKLTRYSLSDAKSYLMLGIASLQPVANFVQTNISDQAFVLDRVVLYFFIIFFVSCLAFLLISLIFKPQNSFIIALPLVVAILLFFNYHLLEAIIHDIAENTLGILVRYRHVVIAQVVIFLLSLLVVLKVAKSPQLCTVFIWSLAVFPVVDLVLVAPEINSQSTLKNLVAFEMPPSVDGSKKLPIQNTKPNVYLILPDAMPAPETVSDIIEGYDYKFASKLKHRGFQMIENSFSNGLLTYLSVAHLFTMDYFVENEEKINADKHSAILATFRGYNPVVAGFRLRGYRYFQVNGSYHIQQCGGYEDVCVGVYKMLKSLDVTFLERTALSRIAFAFRFSYRSPLEMPEVSKRLPAKEEGPFFLFAHFSIPHPPYRYNSDCSKYKTPIYIAPKDPKEWQSMMRKQVACAEFQLDEFVGGIMKKDPKAIIVVQSDHGWYQDTGLLKDQYSYTSEEVRLQNGIFSAFYLPGPCASHLRPGLSPVNTFRIVFACLDGHPPDLLKDRTFIIDKEDTFVTEVYPMSNRRMMPSTEHVPNGRHVRSQ
jgi:hypothetical protein